MLECSKLRDFSRNIAAYIVFGPASYSQKGLANFGTRLSTTFMMCLYSREDIARKISRTNKSLPKMFKLVIKSICFTNNWTQHADSFNSARLPLSLIKLWMRLPLENHINEQVKVTKRNYTPITLSHCNDKPNQINFVYIFHSHFTGVSK